MRVLVMAYQDIGWVCLDELLALGADVAAVVTHRDDPREEIWFRSVADRAREAGVPVLEPTTVNDPGVIADLARLEPDLILSFYFRDILSATVLGLARHAALNLHGSLLPRYRGRCPVNWVLVHGETETGVTLHHMERRPDTGDIVAQRAVPIGDDDTALTLNRKLGDAARVLLRATFPELLAGTAPRVPQDDTRATRFGGRRPEDGRIVWTATARQLHNLVRAVTHPYPGAFSAWRGERLFVWGAKAVDDRDRGEPGRILAVAPDGVLVGTGAGALRLEKVQLEGAREELAGEFANRVGLAVGDHLGGDGC
jgi:methionyl-tRNA formyltransferase